MLVRFYYLSFGAGTVKQYIGQTLVDLPVKGAFGLPAVAQHAWTTPSTSGHYCLQVELDWPDDANPLNNLGQENVQVKQLNSPNATFEVTLRNDSASWRRLILQADTYTLPPKPSCPERPAVYMGDRVLSFAQTDPYSRHRISAYPLPEGWQIEYMPGNPFALGPEQAQIVTVKVTAPDGFVGQQAINVNVLDGATLVGGVTLYVHS